MLISAARWLAKWQQKMSSSSTSFHTLLAYFKSIECEFRFNRPTLCSRLLFAPQNFDLILFRQALYWCRPSRDQAKTLKAYKCLHTVRLASGKAFTFRLFLRPALIYLSASLYALQTRIAYVHKARKGGLAQSSF